MQKFFLATLLAFTTALLSGWMFVGGAAAPTWTAPTAIGTGLQIWVDTFDNAAITLTSSKVSSYAEKSGNAHTCSQSTSTRRPTTTTVGGLQYFNFVKSNPGGGDGLDCAMGGSPLTSFTSCVAYKPTTLTHQDGIITNYVNNGDLNLIVGAGPTNNAAYATAVGETASSTAGTFVTGSLQVVCYTYATGSPGTMKFYVNNTLTGTISSGTAVTARQLATTTSMCNSTGWADGCDGIMGDFVIYNNVLNSTDMGNLYTTFYKVKFPSLP